MPTLTDVPVGLLQPERFTAVYGPQEGRALIDAIARARIELAGRRVFNVNSTARGGGVAEMLQTLLAYARGAGVDARWLVIGGDAEFFTLTKRLHNRLHGSEGDGGPLGASERTLYERSLGPAPRELLDRIGPDDVAILHDPQTAGLVPHLAARGVPVIWRCHVGVDAPDDIVRSAWDFLRHYVLPADGYVFSRAAFAWEGLDPARTHLIAPSIDAFAPKNQELPPAAAEAILHAAGLRDGRPPSAAPVFERSDGSPGRVERRATVFEEAQLSHEDRYVLQVSRWDRLKDPLGVISGFAEHVAPHTDAHLIYAGPDISAVADDPEGAGVLAEARAARDALPPAVRERVHLALLPLDDVDENAATVNALQRRATVVVQKSLAEGFGLTVAEAMWKARPVVATRIGGIQDQIEHGSSGVLLDDPHDLAAYGAAVRGLLDDPAGASAIGVAARERVRAHFLGARSLMDHLALLETVLRVGGAACP